MNPAALTCQARGSHAALDAILRARPAPGPAAAPPGNDVIDRYLASEQARGRRSAGAATRA